MRRHFFSGFTLIELIVVMAIVAILAAATYVAINPAKRAADANNTKRTSDVQAIVDALTQYNADNNGAYPANVLTATTATCIGTTSPCIDLTSSLVSSAGGYLTAIPKDPGGNGLTAGTDANTQYTVQYDTTAKRVTVAAPNAENGKTISLTH